MTLSSNIDSRHQPMRFAPRSGQSRGDGLLKRTLSRQASLVIIRDRVSMAKINEEEETENGKQAQRKVLEAQLLKELLMAGTHTSPKYN